MGKYPQKGKMCLFIECTIKIPSHSVHKLVARMSICSTPYSHKYYWYLHYLEAPHLEDYTSHTQNIQHILDVADDDSFGVA